MKKMNKLMEGKNRCWDQVCDPNSNKDIWDAAWTGFLYYRDLINEQGDDKNE